MSAVEHVLFDCDGVLVDSEPITDRVMQADFAAHGLELRLDQISEMFLGGTMEGAMVQARAMGAVLQDDWLDTIYAQIFSALAEECQVISGVPAMLDQLDAAGVGYSVGSNGPVAKMEVTLGTCGLWDRLVGRVFSAHDCAAAKPAPDVYLKAATHAGRVPAQCVVIEDSVSGARAGQAAGMRCFGYTGDTSAANLAPHCDLVFDDMADLPALLGISTR